MGSRGGKHYDSQVPKCPKCRSEAVVPTGPIRTIKWIDKVPAKCGACGAEWDSENRRLVEAAERLG